MFDVRPVSHARDAAIQHAIDAKTKPRGALGVIETLAAQIARIQDTLTPRLNRCRLIIFAGDHGIAAEGVSAYPQEVTRQMLSNFLAGGAAASVFARVNGVDLHVVDAGVAGVAIHAPGLTLRRIDAGTRNSAVEAAMTPEQCEVALDSGREIGENSAAETTAFGEMGIGNTSSASLIVHKLTGVDLDVLVGCGTGLDAAGLAHKHTALSRAAARTPARLDASRALREYGGFELVMLAGAFIGAAQAGAVVLVDGFIASAAALAAVELAPPLRDYLVFAHRSAEPGHRAVLEALAVRPVLDLDMRLGEGTGALLAWPILKCAAAMLSDMATFETAGVSGAKA